MAETVDWGKLASALRELHRTLLERARGDYEHERGIAVNAGQLLQLLATDPYFAWLRSLSELMVDIDMLREAKPAATDEVLAGVRPAVEKVILAPKTAPAADSFAAHYWPYVQDDPHVAMAHAGVKLAIAAWPLPEKARRRPR